jgi:DNA helicase INO80
MTKGTVEERIVKRAQQKQNVQATVYSGGAFKADIFKPQEVMELLFDENEINVNETKKFMAKSGSKKRTKKPPKEVKVFGVRAKNKKPTMEEDNKSQSNSIIETEKNLYGEKGNEKEGMDFELDFSNLMNEGAIQDLSPEDSDDEND